jgi:hypothetical protein
MSKSFEEHKLLFSFWLAVKFQQTTGSGKSVDKVNTDEYLYFFEV